MKLVWRYNIWTGNSTAITPDGDQITRFGARAPYLYVRKRFGPGMETRGTGARASIAQILKAPLELL